MGDEIAIKRLWTVPTSLMPKGVEHNEAIASSLVQPRGRVSIRSVPCCRDFVVQLRQKRYPRRTPWASRRVVSQCHVIDMPLQSHLAALQALNSLQEPIE